MNVLRQRRGRCVRVNLYQCSDTKHTVLLCLSVNILPSRSRYPLDTSEHLDTFKFLLHLGPFLPLKTLLSYSLCSWMQINLMNQMVSYTDHMQNRHRIFKKKKKKKKKCWSSRHKLVAGILAPCDLVNPVGAKQGEGSLSLSCVFSWLCLRLNAAACISHMSSKTQICYYVVRLLSHVLWHIK